MLSGTPGAGTDGTYPLTFTAANGVGSNATQDFTLTVSQTTAPPAITSASNAKFTVGVAGSFTVTATGNPAPTLSETGALPAGIAFNPDTGVLNGTPAAGTGGVYSITFSAANGTVSQQEQVKQHLAAAAAAVSDLDQRIAGFERSIADTTQRIQRERQELKLLARTMYAQPESPLLAAFGASSLAEALTRFADLAAAGNRAAATKDALDSDLSGL